MAKGITAIDTHVDDGTGICSSEEEELELKAGIQKFYKIKEKDTTKPFKVLGILVTRDAHRGTLKLSQSKYIDSILQRFNMSDCNPVVTPMDKVHTCKLVRLWPARMKKGIKHLLDPLPTPQCQQGPTLGTSPNFCHSQTKHPPNRTGMQQREFCGT